MLTQDLLNEIFTYDPETGILTRHKHTRGPEAKETVDYYRRVHIAGKTHRTHRIIWLMIYGHIPKGMVVDHVNGDYRDNRLVNLRLASDRDNCRNRNVETGSRVPFKGVHTSKGKYRAMIGVTGVPTYLGLFRTAEEAAMAYDKAAVEHFGEFARTNAMMGLLPNTSTNA